MKAWIVGVLIVGAILAACTVSFIREQQQNAKLAQYCREVPYDLACKQ